MPSEEYPVKLELGVRQRMRDGKRLSSDVFRPDAKGRFPVILTRTPYRTVDGYQKMQNDEALFFAKHGYAYVIQDCRGKNDSEGTYRPFQDDDARDGFDTLAWCAAAEMVDRKPGHHRCILLRLEPVDDSHTEAAGPESHGLHGLAP